MSAAVDNRQRAIVIDAASYVNEKIKGVRSGAFTRDDLQSDAQFLNSIKILGAARKIKDFVVKHSRANTGKPVTPPTTFKMAGVDTSGHVSCDGQAQTGPSLGA